MRGPSNIVETAVTCTVVLATRDGLEEPRWSYVYWQILYSSAYFLVIL